MQLQKFTGDSMPVVLDTVRNALGSDAIILANRRVGDHIEIIATGNLDDVSFEHAENFDNTKNRAERNTQANRLETSVAEDSTKNVKEETTELIDQIDNAGSSADQTTLKRNDEPVAESESFANTTVASKDEEESVAEIELAQTDTDVAPTTAEQFDLAIEKRTNAMTDRIIDSVNIEVESKLDHINSTVNKRLSQLEVNLWGEKEPVRSKHLQTLLEMGLGAELAVSLVNRVDTGHAFESALRQSLSDLSATLPVAFDSSLTRSGITFVTGPSGSGKTTTLMKLAAQKVLQSGPENVVLICADAGRVGVFESFAAHGNALGVLVVYARTDKELQEMLLFYANKELILVDQPLAQDFCELPAMENAVGDVNDRSVRHLLVLPATIQSAVADDVVSQFSAHPSARCVITNLDRACRVGELFTTLIRNNLRIAYWSECADIHNPLNKASAPTLVAAAMAMGRRLVPSADDRYLLELIHPRFSASVVPLHLSSL